MNSPCTGRCGLDKNNVCTGCGRTIDQIKKWTVFSDLDRQKILGRLKTEKGEKK